MSETNINKHIPQSYQDFAYRFQLAQGLPQDQKGVIFVGNTRAGKSTLALAMSGAAMKIVYDEGALTFINPSDKKFEKVVRNTQQSVTEQPNFYKSTQGHNKWAIVDMPGHADSSRFRQLINFHYIRTMAANLKEVRFLLVVTLQFKNGTFMLNEKELHMLNSFRIMFPNCSSCVNIIINRIENARQNENAACLCFREAITRSKISGLLEYYGMITDNKIHVIQRPVYRKGANGEEKHEMPYPAINQRMRDICNNQQAEFLKLKQHDYYSLNIFKEGDHTKNKQFYEKLKKIIKRIEQGLQEASQLFRQTVFKFFSSIIEGHSCKSCGEYILKIFSDFLNKHSVECPQMRRLVPMAFKQYFFLQSSKILDLIQYISQEKFTYHAEKANGKPYIKRKQDYCRQVADSYLSKLLQMVRSIFGESDIYLKVMQFYQYLVRRISEYFFIGNILIDKDFIVKQLEEDGINIGDIYYQFQELKNLSQNFSPLFERLVESVVNTDIPILFRNYSSNQYEALENQLVNNFTNIEKLGQKAYKDKEKFQNVILTKISQKKDQINFFVIINKEPETNQDITANIKTLLKFYQSSDLNRRVKIINKLAKLLERIKQYKHALALFLHLSLNQEVMRLLAIWQPTLKKEIVAQVYSEVAASFQENAMFSYAQRCLQHAKRCSIDQLVRFIQYQKKNLNLNDHGYTSPKLKKRLEAKDIESYWNWDKINDQIIFLKHKFNLNNQNPTKSVLLKKYR